MTLVCEHWTVVDQEQRNGHINGQEGGWISNRHFPLLFFFLIISFLPLIISHWPLLVIWIHIPRHSPCIPLLSSIKPHLPRLHWVLCLNKSETELLLTVCFGCCWRHRGPRLSTASWRREQGHHRRCTLASGCCHSGKDWTEPPLLSRESVGGLEKRNRSIYPAIHNNYRSGETPWTRQSITANTNREKINL